MGIDESNHGRYPEIFVAVYSEIPDDVVEHEQLPKVRKRHGGAILPFLKSRSFRHILIPERYGDLFGGKGTSLVVVSEFIRYFNNLEGVIVDGEPKWDVIEGLEKMLHPLPIPKVSFVAKGDTKFGIVNLADHVALEVSWHSRCLTIRPQEAPPVQERSRGVSALLPRSAP